LPAIFSYGAIKMKSLVAIAAATAVASLISGSVMAGSHKTKGGMHGHHEMAGVKVVNAWARATPGMAKNGGAYLTIRNPGKQADRLVAAKGDVAKRVELHTHLMEDGVMRMREVPGIDIPAGGSVTFKPGSYHVMMIGLHKPLKKGDNFSVTLVFEKAGEIETDVRVMEVGAMKGHMKHGGKHKGSGMGHGKHGKGHGGAGNPHK
jgi:copper(I)-binding protein